MQAIPKMVGDGMSYSGTSSANWQRIDPCVSGSLKKGAIAKVDQASKVSMGIVGFFCLKSASRGSSPEHTKIYHKAQGGEKRNLLSNC